MKIHLYASVDILGIVYSACGCRIGFYNDRKNRFWTLGREKRITCKNCMRTKGFKK